VETVAVTLGELPSWRGRLHAFAFFAAVPASLILLVSADGGLETIATAVYVLGVLALFGTSAAYHRLHLDHHRRVLLRRLDHSMIYVLIAGSYTPMCLLGLPRHWGVPILVAVWVITIAGVVVKLTAFHHHRLKVTSYAMYLILGWVMAAAMPELAQHISRTQFLLVIAGGLLYTGGFPVLFTKRPNPWPGRFGYHEVWHAMTVAAAACHFAAIALLVA
jgi:hemolysin III